MKLSDVWFTALSENESGQMITVYGRDELNEFTESGKFKERVEITWKYEGDGRGLPSDDLGEKMEAVEEALRKAMEKKDKLAILTGVYTGGGEKVWVFYTRTVRVFGSAKEYLAAIQDGWSSNIPSGCHLTDLPRTIHEGYAYRRKSYLGRPFGSRPCISWRPR